MSAFELPLHVEIQARRQIAGTDAVTDAATDVGTDAETDAGTETFVLLHGFGASAFSWRYWSGPLSERGDVVLVDLKGFGSAPKPDDGRYSPTEQAEFVHRMIVQRDLRNVTLVGHSLGGGIALLTSLRMLEENSGRLKRLVVIAGAAYKQRLPPFVALARRRRLSSFLFRLIGARRIIRHVLRTIVFDRENVKENQVEGYADPLRSRDGLRALFDAALQVEPPDLDTLTARYPTIGVPALVLWGRHDRVVPLWVGERLAEALPDARLVILEKCGHIPAEELPEESLERLVEFLDATP